METCIFCLRTDGGTAGQEHVLQDFLGASLVLPHGVVCDRCNGFASALDGDLRRYLALTCFRTDDSPMLRGANAVVSIDGTWWATRLDDRTWKRYLPTQCVIKLDGSVDGVANTQQLMIQMQTELANADSIDRRDSDDRLAIAGQPIIVRSAERRFHLLATEADEQRVREVIRSLPSQNWNHRSDLQTSLDRNGAPIRAVLSVNVIHARRAPIKAGYNFLAWALGADVARLPLFMPLRRMVLDNIEVAECFIDGNELRRFAGLPATAPETEAIGAGIFDRELGEAAERVGRAFLQPNVHSLVLGAGRLGMFVFVSLRGLPVARIRLLPRLPGFNINGICAAWTVHPGAQPQLAQTEQLDALRNVLHAWALNLPPESVPKSLPGYVRSLPQPFVIEATYAPSAS